MKKHPKYQSLLQSIRVVSSRVANTSFHRASFGQVLAAAFVTNGGPAGTWDTVNPNEYNALMLPLMCGYTWEEAQQLTRQQRGILIARDPFAMVEWYDKHLTAMLRNLIGLEPGHGNTVAATLRRGVMGFTKWVAAFNEAAGRGGEHTHSQEQVLELRILRRLCGSEEKGLQTLLQPLYGRFVDSIVSAEAFPVLYDVNESRYHVLKGDTEESRLQLNAVLNTPFTPAVCKHDPQTGGLMGS
jgi:hypothetical protein